MAVNGWFGKSTNKGVHSGVILMQTEITRKKESEHISFLSNSDNLYLLDANGYLIRNRKPVKGADRYYYMAPDGNGVAYKNKLIKYGKYRYYFTGNGRRAT